MILLSHSLGVLFVLQLLNQNSTSWCKKSIKYFIALLSPWGGAVDEMFTYASGNTVGVFLVKPLIHNLIQCNLFRIADAMTFQINRKIV